MSAEKPPQYTVYKSRRNPFAGLAKRLRPSLPKKDKKPKREGKEPKLSSKQLKKSKRLSWRRLAKWIALWVVGWLILSLIIFMISAQLNGSVDSATKAVLGGANPLTKPTTILVLGSDKRKGESGRGRSDTLLLWRFDGGRSSKLSIPRDTRVTVPGFGASKINAAFAIGGTALTVKTIEFNFAPIEIDHVMVVNFEGFADLVDALGGVKMEFGRCIVSTFEGKTLRVAKGKQKLDGDKALGVVRARKNRCAPNENDLTRARRQQQFLDAVKSKAKSPLTFVRLPWVAWAAPRAFESDMKGVGLLSLFIEMQRSSNAKTKILPVAPAGGSELRVRDPEYRVAIDNFLNG